MKILNNIFILPLPTIYKIIENLTTGVSLGIGFAIGTEVFKYLYKIIKQ